MPRSVTKKCVACAQLTAAQARELHGPGQKENCWDDKKCPSKRSTYRHRKRRNEQRRLKYQQQRRDLKTEEELLVETVSLPVAAEQPPYANLYIWREKRKDAPLHAIAASVFQEGKKVLEVAPIHCAGYRRRQLENYVQKEIMGYLNARYGITFFAEEIRLEPIECMIEGCPYHNRLEQSQVVSRGWFKNARFRVTLAAQNRPSSRRSLSLITLVSTLSGSA